MLVTNTTGNEWITPALLGNLEIRQVLADRTVSGLAYALTEEMALYRTTDGGQAWGLAADLNPYNDILTPSKLLEASGGVLFIDGRFGTGSCDRAIYVSGDQGLSWEMTAELPNLNYDAGGNFSCALPLDLVIHPSEDTSLHLLVDYRWGILSLHSEDGGRSWDFEEPCCSVGGNPGTLQISAAGDASNIFVYMPDFSSRSSDRGVTWVAGPSEANNYGANNYAAINVFDQDIVYMAVSAQPLGECCVRAQPQVWRSLDGGSSWGITSEKVANEAYPVGVQAYRNPTILRINPSDANQLHLSGLGDPFIFG